MAPPAFGAGMAAPAPINTAPAFDNAPATPDMMGQPKKKKTNTMTFVLLGIVVALIIAIVVFMIINQ